MSAMSAQQRAARIRDKAQAYLVARASETIGAPMPVPETLDRRVIPLRSPEEEIRHQIETAKARRRVDPSQFPRFPWPSVDRLVGRLRFGSLVFVAASTGQGKTTFLLSLVSTLVEEGHGVFYCGLEQSPDELRQKFAALRLNLHPSYPLENRWDELPDGAALAEAFDAELDSQVEGHLLERLWFDPRTHIGVREFRDACAQAVSQGKRLLIVDHIDRTDDVEKGFAEMARMIRLAKDQAVQHQLVVLLASQMNRQARAGDRLAVYQPPQLHHLQMGGVKEHEADVALGVWRPIDVTASKDALAAVRSSAAEPQSVLMKHTMGVVVMKHRLRGESEGQRAFLQVKNGRVGERPAPLPYSLESRGPTG